MSARDYQALMKPRARRQWLFWGAAAALLALAAWLIGLTLEQASQARRSEAALKVALAQRNSPPPPKPSRTEVDAQRRWTALSVERGYSWYPLFRALEQANSQDIELLEFVPDKAGRRIVLKGEARNFEALTSYLDLLSRQSSLREVYLAHQKNVSRTGMALVSFEICASVSDENTQTTMR